ncbi:uncharacterized protein LOC113171727 [Anabas testudineus]|nr:uncharacterized protein LOC113171727 [Anabas testudineus]XP_026230113.1 uncharacterized protein LOC113171727 [Anabas testudineus]XP_026230114.1 uncharacterized protein LOC113171727 [Anabas testudineus]XP_026230115.1 uncharacterized protein LOC113171727 [Anabas testudineus]
MEACMMTPEVKKKPKQETLSVGRELLDSVSENNKAKELQTQSSVSSEDVREPNNTQAAELLHTELSPCTDSMSGHKEQDVNCENRFSSSCENLNDTTDDVKVTRRSPAGLFQRSASTDNLFDEESNRDEEEKLSVRWKNLLEAVAAKENSGRLTGMFKKSPKPCLRSIATEDPLSSIKQLSGSWGSLTDAAEEALSAHSELSATNNLFDATGTIKEREKVEAPEGGTPRCRRTIKKVVSFRIKKTLSKIPAVTFSSQTSDKTSITEETVELSEPNAAQETKVEVQTVHMAAYPNENNLLESQSEQESDELMEWWNTVRGWTEWNETSHFQEEDEEMSVEEAADRVYLAARLFVHLFNQRGASLQHRILELLSLADAADQFHKKTVSAAVGGGVASVAGSVATITGLILAPFTFGASVIVTAVGISVATVGSITSATANITDTVHSRMDRKKVEKMIQGYQEEIKDIRECLEFVQEGMDTLQECDFEQYSQSAATKALNHSVKTVVREGGRAGKALLINTEKLISTVQLLSATGNVVKATRVITITTGVMSGLFLALDVFFLAKNSHELRKGAKTQFAAKVREVCKELQDGLLELNKVKTQLQKTMDGIEVEEYEEEVEIEEDLEWDLVELEQELDLLEEKLDKKVEEEQKKSKEGEKENQKSKEKKKKSTKDEGDPQIKEKEEKEGKKEKDEVEGKLKERPDEDKEMKTETSVKAAIEVLKEQVQKKGKKEIKRQKEKCENEQDKAKKDTGTNRKVNLEKQVEGGSRRNSRENGGGSKPEIRSADKKRRSRSVGDAERLARKESNKTEEEEAVKDWRAETAAKEGTESKRETEMKRDHGKMDTWKEAHRSRDTAPRSENMEREWRSSTEDSDSNRSQDRRAMDLHDEQRDRGAEKRGSNVESVRRQFERGGEEEESDERRWDGESRRERESEHSLRGCRPRSNAVLGDR